MITKAKIGYGSTFSKGDGGSTEKFAPLGEVVNITPPSVARDAVEATHMASTEAWREYIPGLKDGGEVSIEMNLLTGGTAIGIVMSEFNTNTVSNWRVAFPDGASFTFAAVCTGFAPEAPMDSKMTATATFKVSGKPKYATS